MYLGDSDSRINGLLPAVRTTVKDDQELSALLMRKFEDVTFSKKHWHFSSFLDDCVLFLCYLLHYVSTDEFLLFFPDCVNRSAFQKCLRRLSERKLLRLESVDGSATIWSNQAACLTVSGMDYVRQNIASAGYFRNTEKVRRTGGHVNLHDYATGLSFLHFILSPLLFDYEKEAMVGTGILKERRSLCVDLHLQVERILMAASGEENTTKAAVPADTDALLSDTDLTRSTFSYRDIYLEQDNATESISTLAAKIGSYRNHGKDRTDAICIFSYFFPNAGAVTTQSEGLEFSYKHLKRLYADMESHDCSNLSSYLGKAKKDTSCSCAEIAKALYQTVSFGKGYDFTLSEFDRYLKDLEGRRNLYHTHAVNLRQSYYTENRFRLLLEVFARYLTDTSTIHFDETRALLSGFPVFQLPTTLLSSYFPRMFVSEYGTVSSYRDSLLSYYKGLSDTCVDAKRHAYVPLSNGQVADLPDFLLRNIFTHANGEVSVEDIGVDLSAAVRVLYADNYQHAANDLGHPRQIVCIVQSYRQAYHFYDLLLHQRETTKLDTTTDGIYFLLAEDLGRSDKIFGVMRDRMKKEEPYTAVIQHEEHYVDPLEAAFAGLTAEDLLA